MQKITNSSFFTRFRAEKQRAENYKASRSRGHMTLWRDFFKTDKTSVRGHTRNLPCKGVPRDPPMWTRLTCPRRHGYTSRVTRSHQTETPTANLQKITTCEVPR